MSKKCQEHVTCSYQLAGTQALYVPYQYCRVL